MFYNFEEALKLFSESQKSLRGKKLTVESLVDGTISNYRCWLKALNSASGGEVISRFL